jgi:penicillin-binding protein 2
VGPLSAQVADRRRLVVVQVLVMSLFVTLFARLWFLQVASGAQYQRQAASNAGRDLVVQPPRGLIVDDMGRPLAANRLSWVVTVDRDRMAEFSSRRRSEVMRRLARQLDEPLARLQSRTRTCGEAGAPEPPVCWNGAPYQPVPVADDVDQAVAVSIQERGEDFPGISAEQLYVRAYPEPYGVNASHVLGYLSPVTAEEYDAAQARGDKTLNSASTVGRSGLEREYDDDLRGVPGSQGVTVDSLGRVIGQAPDVSAEPGHTLVTSIDARVQGLVERELAGAIRLAGQTVDPVTGRAYEAPAGSMVVMDPETGRVVAMASYPTYEPSDWVGGITSGQLADLYSTRGAQPLLSRATQAQLAPGSTFKPFMALGALENGYTTQTQLNCSSSFTAGNRAFKNFESGAYGYINIAKALQVSCNTFFYRIGYALWLEAGGEDAPVDTVDPLVQAARNVGFGRATGVDLPGEAAGRIADRRWKMDYWRENKDYYCEIAEESGSDYLHVFAREFCVEGYAYRAGDAVNFVIGQGDTTLTPIQLATAYSALANGGTLYEPRVAKAVLGPDGRTVREIRPERAGRVPVSRRNLRAVDTALMGTPRDGTLAWKMDGFPLDQVPLRAKTGTAEVYGRQTTSWLATYTRDYVVVSMIEQAGTGSGAAGDAVRRIWEGLYGIVDGKVHPDKALIAGIEAPKRLPVFRPDGSIEAPRGTPDTEGRRRSGRQR